MIDSIQNRKCAIRFGCVGLPLIDALRVPVLPKMRHDNLRATESHALQPKYLASLDAVLIATEHTGFNCDSIVKHAPLGDTRNATVCVNQNRENSHKT